MSTITDKENPVFKQIFLCWIVANVQNDNLVNQKDDEWSKAFKGSREFDENMARFGKLSRYSTDGNITNLNQKVLKNCCTINENIAGELGLLIYFCWLFWARETSLLDLSA